MKTYIRNGSGVTVWEMDIFGHPRKCFHQYTPREVRDAFEYYGADKIEYDGFELKPIKLERPMPMVVERRVEVPVVVERRVPVVTHRDAGAGAAILGVLFGAAVGAAAANRRYAK